MTDDDAPPSATELHRRACEARWVLALPPAHGNAYLALVRKLRGEEGWAVLMRDLAAAQREATC